MQTVPAALTRIQTLIEDDDVPPHVQLKASTEVLDRVGVRGGTEIDVKVEDGSADPAEALQVRLEQLRERAAASAARTSLPENTSDHSIIDGEIIPDDHDQDQLSLFGDDE